MKLKDKRFTVGQVAEFCAVNRVTVLKWVEEGRIEHFKLPSGHLRVTHESLLTFMNEYKMPLAKELIDHKKKVLLLSGDLELAGFLQQAFQAFEDREFDIQLSHSLMEAIFLIGMEEPDILVYDQRIVNFSQAEVEKVLRSFPQYNKTARLTFAAVSQTETPGVFHKPWSLEKVKAALKAMAL